MRVKVQFYRYAIEQAHGRAFPATIDSVEINECRTMDEALTRAIKAFEEEHNLTSWQEGADYYGLS